ncbi:hypothetical protein SLA2020_424130 [Shorea laevis]
MEFSATNAAHAVLVSSPGHLLPILELGKLLVTSHNVGVTILVVSNHLTANGESLIVQSAIASNLYNVIHLPPVDTSNRASGPGITHIVLAVREIKPALRSALSALESPPTALILHHLAFDCFEIADEFEIPKFVYVSPNAWFLALLSYTPVLDKIVEGNFVDHKENLVIPDCRSVRPKEVPTPLAYRKSSDYAEFLHVAMEIPKADGILVNTWEELQPRTLAALRDEKLLGGIVKAAIYPIGPIYRAPSKELSSELSEWLGKQPKESVVYVSFGNKGGISVEQIVELAWGLELSQQRFIWVVRPPVQKTGIGVHAKIGNNDVSFLPQGFVDRTREVGLLIPQWAPQVEILNNPSVGAFFSHCGWNSTVECICCGLPMIAWPLFAEQKMNATLLTEELGIAVRSEILPTEGIVGREEIKRMIRRVTVDEEGGGMRERAKALKLAAAKAHKEGGSSYNAMAQLAKKLCISDSSC